jgi:hypothetical protein
MAIEKADTTATLAVRLGSVMRVEFTSLHEKMAQRRFSEEGLHNQAGVVPFNGENGGSTPTPYRR